MNTENDNQQPMNFLQMLRKAEEDKKSGDITPEYAHWLMETEGHLRAFMTNAKNFAVYRLVRDDNSPYGVEVVFVSPSMKDILGVEDPTQVHLWFEKAHPDDFERIIRANMEAFQTLKLDETIRYFHAPTEQWRWIQVLGTGSQDAEGEAMYANGIIIDVTEQKKAEQAHKESEEKYRDLVENINDVLFALDREGLCTYMSPVVKNVLGVDPDDLVGKYLHEFMPEHQKKAYLENMAKLDAGKNLSSEYEIIGPDGQSHWIRTSSRPTEVDGKVTGIRGTFRDITDYVRAQQDKRRLEEQLEHSQKLEAIGTLAGGIAHNLNNVLYPIVGYTEMAIEDIPEDSPAHESLQEVLYAADRARELVYQILTYSRRSEEKLEALDLNPIMKEVIKLISAAVPSTIKVEQSLAPNIPAILADAAQIHHVVMNLCTNAYHSMRDTGGILDITLGFVEIKQDQDAPVPNMPPGGYVKISVSDQGQGIDEGIRDRIFEPYFTTKGVGEGTGMGLALTLAIVTKVNGFINVTSIPGRGSTFDLYFPSTDKAPVISIPEFHGPAPRGGESILLVEDDQQILHMTQQMLERQGYRVDPYDSGIDGLEAFYKNPKKYDLVITDMTMPLMTGDQLAVEIMQKSPDTPVILCTGFSEHISQEQAEALGVAAFLMKPMARNRVAGIVRRVLDKAKMKKD
ncbi:hybrid sensor histidine kinase/response regulator [Desulfatibacillum aliphaticivorans]|uniref:hybrid sensor histidine kinase/response regulator n=1 Tax=Desulfatibacillum aliphaticivorans TaxID=218208 RepID=UPI0004090E0A|nr:PAS domain-containing sensor histidine kinase [Desulfatibacillum aliphaticivorans]